MSAEITMAVNAFGFGWYFDQTPNDDIEFTGLASDHAASFVDETAQSNDRVFDFYRVLLHEIGHSIGISSAYRKYFESFDEDSLSILRDGQGNQLAIIDSARSGHFSRFVHPDFVMSTPNQRFVDGKFETAPYGDPAATLRLFISDFEAEILEEVYSYDINLPSTLDSAHVMLDSRMETRSPASLSSFRKAA